MGMQQQLSSFAQNVRVIDDTHLAEEEEEKMLAIYDDLDEMKKMFVNLDELVNEQDEAVDKLECNVKVIKEHVDAGKDQLIIGERNQNRKRMNKIILLIVLIIVLAIIIAFVWAYDRSK